MSKKKYIKCLTITRDKTRSCRYFIYWTKKHKILEVDKFSCSLTVLLHMYCTVHISICNTIIKNTSWHYCILDFHTVSCLCAPAARLYSRQQISLAWTDGASIWSHPLHRERLILHLLLILPIINWIITIVFSSILAFKTIKVKVN